MAKARGSINTTAIILTIEASATILPGLEDFRSLEQ